jgi:Tfp pilus assembly protein PilF
MFASLAAALVLTFATQSSAADDRVRAMELARTGRTEDALALFEQIVGANPDDVDARLWVARLDLRLGRVERSEAGFRAVLRDHPSDVDAHIGLGGVLIRRGAWQEALDELREVEPAAGENAELFAVLARAWRRSGDDRRALEYLRRAKALSPRDSDIVHDFEDTAQAYGGSISFNGFAEHVTPSTNTDSATLAASFRVSTPLRISVSYRLQHNVNVSDATGGAGFEWRVDRATTLTAYALAGPGNVSLPTRDVWSGVVHYRGPFELGGDVRFLSFNDVDVLAASPIIAWDRGGRWRVDTRYTYSHSSFHETRETSGVSSVLLRATWRRWWRFNVNAAYAYGIESFEDLTRDRVNALGASTIAAGVRIRTPALAQIFATWEHQWRSNDATMDRFTLALRQTFP